MKHILEKKILFNGVIVRTYWMTLVYMYVHSAHLLSHIESTPGVQEFSALKLGPNKHGLVTYIHVNVYIGNTLSWLNGG